VKLFINILEQITVPSQTKQSNIANKRVVNGKKNKKINKTHTGLPVDSSSA